MNLTVNNDLIRAEFPFSAETINRVKKTGLRWNPREKSWDSPFSYHVIDGLKKEFPELSLDTPELPSCNGWEPSTYLMAHQKEAAEIALKYPRYGFFDDCGTGKTISSLEIIKQKKIKTLVLCKLSLIENAWMVDSKRFAPELKVVNLWEALKKRKKIPEHDVGIINYESFRTHHQKLTGYQMVIADESAVLKDSRSQITKIMISYTDKIPFVYLLSGMPAPNDPLEYFPQFRIIDQSLLGKSFYSFRNHFCFATGFGGYKWEMRPDMKEEFLELIGKKSRVVLKKDVLDLPERTFSVRTVYLTDKEMEAYRKMETDMILEIGDQESVASNSAVKLLKLRQGTSGFYYDEDGKAIVVGHSKLEVLKDLLSEIGNHQVILFTQFHVEADQIEKLLGEKAVRIDGTVSNQTVKNELLKEFMEGKKQYLISHPASLGHGITLTQVNYMIYYSQSYSLEQFYQSRDRIHRFGQRNACSYYHLVAHKTVDEVVVKALEKKESVVNSIFQYLKRNKV